MSPEDSVVEEERPAQASLPESLPILPLRNTVLYPVLITPMLAATDRARLLVDDALAGDRLLVAVASRDREIEEPGAGDLYDVGTAVRILRMLKTDDGMHRLWVQGIRRVRIVDIFETEPFLRARIEPLDEVIEPGVELEALEHNARTRFLELAEDSGTVSEAIRTLVAGIEDPSVLADVVAANLGLPVEERQEILELTDLRKRLERVSVSLAREGEVRRLEEEVRQEVQSELSKNQRDYVLREQARAIRRQLGESQSPEEMVEELRRRLDEAEPPEPVREQAERELNRLAALPPGAVEAGTIRTYLEWIADLPWTKETTDVLDVKSAREVLEEDHYDLEKVKDRILEYIAVLKLKQDMRGPILCFVGPPGVGKTSLGRSIARATGRDFARIALGGVRDEAEIRGHRRTYVGALPGRIVQTMRRVGTRNPVFMLDEIDKLGTDFRGDPSSALLEVLDPEQNHAFSDHYLEVPFDLSKVMFIATANVLENVPPALRDRLEIIELPGYTEEDKLEIARRYLVPRQVENNGVAEYMPELSDDVLRAITRGYTREAGVRNLERELGKLARKIAREVVGTGRGLDKIEPDDLHSVLGSARFQAEIAGRVHQPGVVVGLAVTEAGGEILFIEATRMAGKGQLSITGSVGEVMRESAETAVSVVRDRAEQLGVDPEIFTKSDLHVHVPAGATPKDGPSAGLAIITALTSLLRDRPAPPDLAMTGEITLRGRVLPVGGIKEKILAAKRAGVSRVVIPARNEKDLVEIPDARLAGLTIEPVETIDQVLQHIFGDESASSATAT
jgi:ATP-dependent Lon protease